jgi:hypothetical protein
MVLTGGTPLQFTCSSDLKFLRHIFLRLHLGHTVK